MKDTPLERRQHESTGKHQGNLKRFLNGIQKTHDRNEREKDKAVAEVERLNRVVGSSSSSSASTSQPTKGFAAKTNSSTAPSVAAAADQKRQWSQLAEMGIAVPASARAEVAMAGDWQVSARKSVLRSEDAVDDKLNVGVRKRKFADEVGEEEDLANSMVPRKTWGSSTKTYPGNTTHADDLDDLLGAPIGTTTTTAPSILNNQTGTVKIERDTEKSITTPSNTSPIIDQPSDAAFRSTTIKREDESGKLPSSLELDTHSTQIPVFKKRKPKNSTST